MSQKTFQNHKPTRIATCLLLVLMLSSFIGFITLLKKNIDLKKELKSTYSISIGKITNIKKVSGGKYDGQALKFSYSFNDSGVCYATHKKYSIIKNKFILPLPHHFIDKNFPLLLAERKDGPVDILITQKDFTQYGLTFPNSLQWTYKYFYK
jgi:hypothetical protein